MECGNGQPEKIIVISWQSKGQPERADMYYHASCYRKCPVVLPDGEMSEIERGEVAKHITCSSCGWYLNF